MYWNVCNLSDRPRSWRLTLTWDVLKHFFPLLSIHWFEINFNMGCIETNSDEARAYRGEWLTLTWDVLKLFYNIEELRHIKINFNMGCIETYKFYIIRATSNRLTLTWDVLKPKNWAAESETGSRINFNMGCIET